MSAHVSAAEAARVYGLSDKTVRRWIRAGRLRADKRDGAYSVLLDDVSALVGHVSAAPSARESAPGADTASEDVRPPERPGTDIMRAEAMAAYTRSILEPLVAQVDELQRRLEAWTEAATAHRLRAEGLAAQLAQAEERIKALEAPQAVMGANLTAHGPETSMEPSDANCHQNGEAANLTAEAPEPPMGPSRRRWWALW